MSTRQQSEAGKQRSWRTRILRLAAISKALKNRRHINCSRLADELEISSKTVWRDIELLRDLGHQIDFDPDLNSYFYRAIPDWIL